jgi:hypothetical protein
MKLHSLISQSADGYASLSEVVDTKICSEFDVASASARRDAEQFVDELSKHGILREPVPVPSFCTAEAP